MDQQQFVGLDVSQAETAVCVIDAAGATVWQGKCASDPEAIAGTLRRHVSVVHGSVCWLVMGRWVS